MPDTRDELNVSADEDASEPSLDKPQTKKERDGPSRFTNFSSTSQPSYVYPVKSLLAGVQPARISDQVLGLSPSEATRYSALRTTSADLVSPSERLSPRDKSYFSLGEMGEIMQHHRSRDISPPRVLDSSPDGNGGTRPESTSTSNSLDANKEAVLFPRNSLEDSTPQPIQNQDTIITTPDGTVMSYVSHGDRDDDEYNPRRPQPFDSAAATALMDSQTPLAFSQGGYVHLDASGSEGSSKWGSHAGSISGSLRRAGKLARMGQQGSATASSRLDSGSEPDGGYTADSGGQASSALSVRSDQNSMTSSHDEPLLAFRFQHVQTEEGHHVVTGREGKLLRCEDEPIRVPGAVQGFGVLIALREDEGSGNLVVRQVSENSTEILGLSPKYLFSLDCFTSVLPDSQAELLWDNIQFLTDPDLDEEAGSDESPQVFLLSGWGEPGSMLFDDSDRSNGPPPELRTENRRSWTCWCAIHRPPAASLSTSTDKSLPRQSDLVVLEFELERDIFNPPYPPPPILPSKISSGSSPGTASTSNESDGKNTEGSSSTVGAGQAGESSMSTSSGTPLIADPQNSQSLSLQVEGVAQSVTSAFPTRGLVGDDTWFPSAEDVLESTTNRARPLRALERMRRITRNVESRSPPITSSKPRNTQGRRGVGTMDVFAVLAQVNEQLGATEDLQTFLKIVVGIVKDLTQFHRVVIYQFDEHWNGQVVAELVDWNQTHDLYNSLHFPASDIPAQARQLYAINKVRLLYDRDQPTARLVVRSRKDLETPLDMTHSFLRAMSPIHIKYLGNMGVRASMSVSIVTFGALWGLIACHSYGGAGMRVSFPVRQMLRLLSDSVSRNIERLSYAQRLHTRKLISTLPTDQHPTGYIVTNAEDLLGLFDADFGVLVIGEGAKILGPNQHGQEILIVAEYLRLKQFKLMQVSQSVAKDFPDLQLLTGMDVIAGLLYLPLTAGGKDFIVFLRKGQLREVHWAGKPFKDGYEKTAALEPRKSFKMWSETVSGRCRAWTDEQLETAGVLALVYGKFIDVWRQKENALQNTQLTNILLSNASHEVRTPLNQIINYLEMALHSPLDAETRENLERSHTASKGLLFTINDLLDLTKLESGNETTFNEPFDIRDSIRQAVQLYRLEARRCNIEFNLNLDHAPQIVVGDSRKIRTIVANLTANAVKYTTNGSISVECRIFTEPKGLRNSKEIAVEIVVADTGCGISRPMLESIFREFEQVQGTDLQPSAPSTGLGLGLAVVARSVQQLGGQLRVDSKPNEGSRFSLVVPFATSRPARSSDVLLSSGNSSSRSYMSHHAVESRSRTNSEGSGGSEIESLVEALGSSHMHQPGSPSASASRRSSVRKKAPLRHDGKFEVDGSNFPIRSLKVDEFDVDVQPNSPTAPAEEVPQLLKAPKVEATSVRAPLLRKAPSSSNNLRSLRILVVEDDTFNCTILCKRLKLDKHDVAIASNGKEAYEIIERDQDFDAILMDIQMPILNGFQATEKIRDFERNLGNNEEPSRRLSHILNERIPIFAVSASLKESQREDMLGLGMDGWVLKPIDFKRLRVLLNGITDSSQRLQDVYKAGCSWENGGWLRYSSEKSENSDSRELAQSSDSDREEPPATSE